MCLRPVCLLFILLLSLSVLGGCVKVLDSDISTTQLTKNGSHTYSDDPDDDDDPLKPTLQTKVLAITVVSIAVVGVVVTAIAMGSMHQFARGMASKMVHN